MQNESTRACLALHRTPQLSDRMLSRLMTEIDDPQEIFHLSPSTMTDLGVPLGVQSSLRRYSATANTALNQRVEKDWQILQQKHIQLITLSSREYPELLKQISDPPPFLYARGNINILDNPQIAMVGSRRTSRQGMENAIRFSRELASNGFTITSGLALGVDAQSHIGALEVEGATLAVLGTGVDLVYPARHHDLAEKIVQNGLLISEFALETPPRPHNFPRRNRIISGLSLAVLVVEAALQSGSLITARMALEQNREVLAIPSSIHNPGGKGCNALIRQGAKLVETIDDVIEELGGWLLPQVVSTISPGTDKKSPDLSDRENQLLDILGFDSASLDLLQQTSRWDTSELLATLTILEIKGVIENHEGLYLRLFFTKEKI
ncbi:MAG: DNA processing protein [Oceanicoccus sp.]|jgi:DNA processing protein